MSTWIIEPRDVLLLKDSRPAIGGNIQMRSLPIPYPQAIAGFFRARSSVDKNGAFVIPKNKKRQDHLEELKKIKVRGPWLGILNNKGELEEHIVPAPRDAVLFQKEEQSYFIRLGLRQKPCSEEEQHDLSHEEDLQLVFLAKKVKDKVSSAPPLWRWSKMKEWLTNPQDEIQFRSPSHPKEKKPLLLDFAIAHPVVSLRAGIKVNDETETTEEGILFFTEYREFFTPKNPKEINKRINLAQKKLCLIASTEENNIQSGTVPFAGKRRIVHLKTTDKTEPSVKEKDIEALLNKIAQQGEARVILLTPAYFTSGWKPSFLLKGNEKLKITLKGAIVPLPQIVSGWDLEKKQPKPTRRLVAAGSVYFIKLDGSVEARKKWLKKHWWQSISDTEQARRDGFGLAVFGVNKPISS